MQQDTGSGEIKIHIPGLSKPPTLQGGGGEGGEGGRGWVLSSELHCYQHHRDFKYALATVCAWQISRLAVHYTERDFTEGENQLFAAS